MSDHLARRGDVRSPTNVPKASSSEDAMRYGLVASGTPVESRDVESHHDTVEVVVLWGDDSVLRVEHVDPRSTWAVGESGSKRSEVQFIIGSDVLGRNRLPVVFSGRGGAAAVIPEGATGTVKTGDAIVTLSELGTQGRLLPSAAAPDAHQWPLSKGTTVRVEYRGLVFVTRLVPAGRRFVSTVMERMAPLVRFGRYLGSVSALAALFLVAMYFQPPTGSGLHIDYLDRQNRLVHYAVSANELVFEPPPESHGSDSTSGPEGQPHSGEEGQMGDVTAERANRRFGIKGRPDHPDPHMAERTAREQARVAGILGVLTQTSGSWNQPTSPFGRETAEGQDAENAIGHLFGEQIGADFGFNGLGLNDAGRGGGHGPDGTIGVTTLGRIGPGLRPGDRGRYQAAGVFDRTPSHHGPVLRPGPIESVGSLSKEVIRRVIRRHLNEVRYCYERQLGAQPDLAGRVTVSFIIAPTGAVQSSGVRSSTLGNAGVDNCIARAARRWSFPQPEGGGVVAVNYPFVLSPAG